MGDVGYKLLGFAVWKGGTWYLRRRYGPAMLPKPALAGVVLIAVGAVAAAAARSRSRSSGSADA